MLKDLGVTYVIIGHSERREMGETDEQVNKKLHSVLKEGLTPVVCIGEKKRDQWGRYLGQVESQIRKACAGISKAKLEQLVIAYEPIWAIGTGDTATSADVHEMKIFIQKVLTDIFGRGPAHKVRILYGGSVNAKNAAELMQEGMADGFLVGGASLRAEEFVGVIKEAS
jgi:triosephosphate isomerase